MRPSAYEPVVSASFMSFGSLSGYAVAGGLQLWVVGGFHSRLNLAQQLGKGGLAPEPAGDILARRFGRHRHPALVVHGFEIIDGAADEEVQPEILATFGCFRGHRL